MAAKRRKELDGFGDNLPRAYRRTQMCTGLTDLLRLFAAIHSGFAFAKFSPLSPAMSPAPLVKRLLLLCVVVGAFVLSACGSLEKKSALINPGDTKERVLEIMGPPGDRQFQGKDEAWQYGQTGAGFGYHDFRVVWFYDGRVTGLTSYKDYTPASSASAHFKRIEWDQAPARRIEVIQR